MQLRSLGGLVGFALLAGSAGAIGLACTSDYQKGLDDPNYGAPNALAGMKQPGSSTDFTSGAGGGDGGAGSSSGGGAQPVCVTQGEKLLGDAGACAVSFKTDVLGAFGTASPSCASSSSCHGGQNPANQPKIDPGNADGTYREFVAFKLSTGVAYINPCSQDPAKAGIACNVDSANGCGSHMPVGGQMPADQVQKIKDWVKCGSPNN